MRPYWLTLTLGVVGGLAGLLGTPAHADTVFFSGRVDVNPAFGGNVITGVKDFSGLSGYNYSNLDRSTNTVTVLGFAQFSTSMAGSALGIPADPSQRLVAVYALQGTFTGNLNTNTLSADFNLGLGAMRVYDFVNSAVLNVLDPGTWVKDINNLSKSAVAEFDLAERPAAMQQGPPGGIDTDSLFTFDPTKVNTARGTVGNIAQGSATADVKFHYLGSGDPNVQTLLDYSPAGYIVNPLDPTLLVSLTERLDSGSSTDWNIAGNLANTEKVFQGLLGVLFVKPGDTFNPAGLGANGDTIMAVDGGTGIPGSQTPVPEPATLAGALLGSGLLSAFGLLFRRKR